MWSIWYCLPPGIREQLHIRSVKALMGDQSSAFARRERGRTARSDRRRPLAARWAETGVCMRIAGILLIVAGMTAFLFGGFSYKSHTRILDADLVMVSATEDHAVRIPPLLGIAAILAGGGLMFLRIQWVRKGQ